MVSSANPDAQRAEQHSVNAVLPPRADSELPHLGTYVREMAVSVERMYENALDWAHLPHLHSSTFSAIELLAGDADGWRARVWNAGPRAASDSVIELRLDRTCRRWITRTSEGAQGGSEIWTHCIPLADRRVVVVVDFFVPGIAAAARTRAGDAYAALYARLYDEDERMMVRRQRELDTRAQLPPLPRAHAAVNLGPAAALTALLPLDVTVGARRYRVTDAAGRLCAFALTCPHALGPLDDAPIVAGHVTCPWHGYRFDVHTGRCADAGATCHLPVLEVVTDVAGNALLV